MKNNFEPLMVTTGRVLLGIYFFLPGGISKVFNYGGTAQSMADHGMVFVPFFLVLTIIIQLGGGAAMIVGYQTKIVAFVFAGLTLVISLVMHDFWTLPAGELQTGHETQNFVKNLGIMAGLLVMAGLGGGKWSIDAQRSTQA
jgi:putative oxidoreductase